MRVLIHCIVRGALQGYDVLVYRRCRARLGSSASVIAGLATILLVLSASVSLAQTVDTTLWVTDGYVYSVVRDGGTIYIGGSFTRVGPATGGAFAIDAGTGTVQQPYPKVLGDVVAVAPDGSGGWYLGGSFTAVRGQVRNNLAHLDANGNLTSWNPSPDGDIGALAVSGNTVYAAGSFTSVGGQPRHGLAALDAATGAATTWNPNPDGAACLGCAGVNLLAVSGSTVYAAGGFASVGGQPRQYLAAIDAASGAATPWNPAPNNRVFALAASEGTIYVGGSFNGIGGKTRFGIAALDAATGVATVWNPNAINFPVQVNALAVSGGTVYVGGYFDAIGGQTRSNIAALDAATGAATAWNPNPAADALSVHFGSGLAASGGTLYVSGGFTSIGGQSRHNLAALDLATGAATAWNPDLAGGGGALAVSGSTIYVGGGRFDMRGGQPRHNLAALDATTGIATAWDPNPDNSVSALAVSGSTVYAAGGFTSIGGQPRHTLAALDAATGAALAWNPNPDGGVSAMVVGGSTVYAGGSFYLIGGQPRHYLAALDAATGAATAWNPNADDGVNLLAVSGNTVYAAGLFTSIGGFSRQYVAALDATTGTATAWNPNPDGGVLAMAISGGTVYAGGGFTSIGGQPRQYLAALDATTGAATAWNPNPDGVVQAMAVSGGAVYVGGAFTSIGGQLRRFLAALDPTSSVPTTWNPDANRPVYALSVSGSTAYAGGSFFGMGSQPQSGLAAIITDTPTATLLAQFDATSAADGIELRWSFGDPSRVATVAVERAVQATGPWTLIAPEIQDESGVTVALDRVTDGSGEYFYRLVAQLTDGSQATFGPVSVSRDEPLAISDLTVLSPNPTSGGAEVRYAVGRRGQIRLELMDVCGRVVATLADRIEGPGRYIAAWDGTGQRGRLAPGLYFVHLVAPDRAAVRKLAIVR